MEPRPKCLGDQGASMADALVCFVHIEKAAGMTLHAIFRNNWPLQYLTLVPWYRWSNEKGGELQPDELRRILTLLPWTRGLGGHTVRPYLDYEAAVGREIRYITMLRDPITRYLSHFEYQCGVMGQDWTLDSFMNERRFDNYMTKRLAGDFDLDFAKEQLERKFTFVRLMDRFDESLILMASAIGAKGLDLRYTKQNVRVKPKVQPKKELSEGVLKRIRENNALDLKLWDFVVDTLYPTYVERYRGNLESRLSQHAESIRDYRFPRYRELMWQAYRNGLYRHIEQIFHWRYAIRARDY